MRTEQIHYLREIAKVKSLNMASKNLNISVQALGNSMKRLEEEVGYKILETTYSGSYLTSEGEELLEAGLEFIYKLDKIGEAVGGKRNLKKWSYQFACLPGVMEVVLPQFLIEFERFHKNSMLQPVILPYQNLEAQLLSGEWRYVLGFESHVNGEIVPQWDKNFEFIQLKRLNFYCGVSERLIISRQKSMALKDMGKYDIILLDAPDCVSTHDILKRIFPDKTIKIYASHNLYYRVLRESKSICLTLSMDSLAEKVEGIKYLPIIDKRLQNDFGYIKLKNVILNEQDKLFLEMMQEFLAAY